MNAWFLPHLVGLDGDRNARLPCKMTAARKAVLPDLIASWQRPGRSALLFIARKVLYNVTI